MTNDVRWIVTYWPRSGASPFEVTVCGWPDAKSDAEYIISVRLADAS